jgi:hypothetical protein
MGLAVTWLMVAATIQFVPKPRRPDGELPLWKQVVWLILFLLTFIVLVAIWKGG